jgi:hypothetical protein
VSYDWGPHRALPAAGRKPGKLGVGNTVKCKEYARLQTEHPTLLLVYSSDTKQVIFLTR